jgi:hypothetical protein
MVRANAANTAGWLDYSAAVLMLPVRSSRDRYADDVPVQLFILVSAAWISGGARRPETVPSVS